MHIFAAIPPHLAEAALRHVWTTGNDEDTALRHLGDALPEDVPATIRLTWSTSTETLARLG